MSVQRDLEYCREIIQDVSRTFALGIERLGDPIKDFICVSYLLCRIPDTIEDSSRFSLSRKKEILGDYEELLNNENRTEEGINNFVKKSIQGRESKRYWDLVENTNRVFRSFDSFPEEIKDSVTPNIIEMIKGMRKMIDRHEGRIRIKDMKEFSEYCYYVAGTVGNLLTEIFPVTEDIGHRTIKEMREYATNFGEALQTVNIIKDVYSDYKEENSIYIPQELLKKYGGSQQKLFQDRNAFISAINTLNNHASSRLEEAQTYIKLIPKEAKNARDFTIIPYLLAISTLRKVRNNKKELFEPDSIKIDKSEVFSILQLVPRCVESNSYLDRVANIAKKRKISSEIEIEAS